MESGNTSLGLEATRARQGEVKGGAGVRGAEPDQGQQDEAGSEQQDQKVEQQQEAQEGEVGLDSGAKEAE